MAEEAAIPLRRQTSHHPTCTVGRDPGRVCWRSRSESAWPRSGRSSRKITQAVGPRSKHSREREAYRHGHERRQLTLGGRRVEVSKPRARSKAGEEVELESYRLFASRDLPHRGRPDLDCWPGSRPAATGDRRDPTASGRHQLRQGRGPACRRRSGHRQGVRRTQTRVERWRAWRRSSVHSRWKLAPPS